MNKNEHSVICLSVPELSRRKKKRRTLQSLFLVEGVYGVYGAYIYIYSTYLIEMLCQFPLEITQKNFDSICN